MNFAFVIAGLLANNFISVDATSKSEPQCYSRFDYEYKVVEKLFTLETAYKKQQEIMQELKDALEETKNENKVLKKEMEDLKNVSVQKEGKFVAFSAYLDHTLSNIGNDQTIEFNQIILNEGGDYDQRTGVFTCPQSGLYLIAFFIGVRGPGDFYATLMINNYSRIDAVAEGFHDRQDIQGGNSVLVKLNKDDKLWIKRNDGLGKSKLDSHPGIRISTFSGVLLHPQL